MYGHKILSYTHIKYGIHTHKPWKLLEVQIS